MTINRNCLTKADAVVIAAIEAGVPSLIEARALVDQFHDMIRKKDEAKLDLWIANAKRSLVSSFATGVLKDRAAVRAAILQPWSNGQAPLALKEQMVWVERALPRSEHVGSPATQGFLNVAGS